MTALADLLLPANWTTVGFGTCNGGSTGGGGPPSTVLVSAIAAGIVGILLVMIGVFMCRRRKAEPEYEEMVDQYAYYE